METPDPASFSNLTLIALAMMSVSVVVAIVFGILWKRANNRLEGWQREVAQKRALLADANDRLILEGHTSTHLTTALETANHTIAQNQHELTSAREKIASLNKENDSLYENCQKIQQESKALAVEPRYRRYFLQKALNNSRWYLEKADVLLKGALRTPNGASLAGTLDPIESALELVELAHTEDLVQRLREMRADGQRPLIHLIPRLRRFVDDWEQTYGSRVTATIPLADKAVLFAGAWVHLELVLTTIFANALKHSIQSAPIEFEFSTTDHMATFQLTNLSAAPVPESVIRAKNEIVLGDLERPRFGLYLLEQISAGYRAMMKIENVGLAPDGANHVVRTSFSFSLR